ncbi:hypothetical protein Efla_005317 [Eimeria flavescens]
MLPVRISRAHSGCCLDKWDSFLPPLPPAFFSVASCVWPGALALPAAADSSSRGEGAGGGGGWLAMHSVFLSCCRVSAEARACCGCGASSLRRLPLSLSLSGPPKPLLPFFSDTSPARDAFSLAAPSATKAGSPFTAAATQAGPRRCRAIAGLAAAGGTKVNAADAAGAPGPRPPHLLPLRRRLKAVRRLDARIQKQVLMQGLGRPRCQRAQRLLKRGKRDPQSVSARCPLFLQQLKPRLRLWKKALNPSDLPPPLYPEVAFAGRSNVGKSSLLNELCGRSGTAFVCRRPGSTQELHFYKAGSPCSLCLVDLPGYGYAEAEEAKRLQWTEMCLLYLKTRPNLRRVFLLIDSRWGLKASDLTLLSFFERHRVPFQVVLTKADLPEQKTLIKLLQIVSAEVTQCRGCVGPPLAVSALRHRGLDPLRAEIDKLRLSKEVVVGRLKMQARRRANLLEARRLKKEARAKAKTEGAAAQPAADGDREAAAAAAAPTDVVAVALQRWQAALQQNGEGHSSAGLRRPAESSQQQPAAAPAPAASAAALFAVKSEGGGGEGEVGRRDLGGMRVEEEAAADAFAADAVEGALDAATEGLPLSALSSSAECLLRDLLPAAPALEGAAAAAAAEASESSGLREGKASAAAVASCLPAAATVEGEARACSASAAAGDARDALEGAAEDKEEGWEGGHTHQAFTLRQQAPRVRLRCFPDEQPTASAEDSRSWPQAASGRQARTAASRCPAADGLGRGETQLAASEGEGIPEHPAAEEAPLGFRQAAAGKGRSLQIVRLKDWRARRVSSAAVEIDMRLSANEAARSGAKLQLHLAGAATDSSTSSSSSRGADGEAAAAAAAKKQQQQPHRALPNLKRILQAGSGFVDADTLAAERLGRPWRAPASNALGGLETEMRRSFEHKWRRKLLPVGCIVSTGSCVLVTLLFLPDKRNPFRIPSDFITTDEDSGRNKTVKRKALEDRLQKALAQPFNPASESRGGDRSSADSLLFSAAHRRQERSLKRLKSLRGLRSLRGKEMSWEVAYRKWSRWARAHPTLARLNSRLVVGDTSSNDLLQHMALDCLVASSP